jgi:hypothetical protein
MPRGDRRGPEGFGQMTGRGAGYCAGFNTPGFANPGNFCRYHSFGFGGRRGRRNMYYATGLPFWARNIRPYETAAENVEAEIDFLSQESELLKEQLKSIEDRLEQLKKAEKKDPDEK